VIRTNKTIKFYINWNLSKALVANKQMIVMYTSPKQVAHFFSFYVYLSRITADFYGWIFTKFYIRFLGDPLLLLLLLSKFVERTFADATNALKKQLHVI